MLTDSEKLRMLADWTDFKYPNDHNSEVQTDLRKIAAYLEEQEAELQRYRKWIVDLQSGMYISCVYCGHRYGPSEEVPVSRAETLKQHIENCPEHPMSKLKSRCAELEYALWALYSHTKNNMQICGINQIAKEALKV